MRKTWNIWLGVQPSRDCWYPRLESPRHGIRGMARQARASLRRGRTTTEDAGGYTTDAGRAGAGKCGRRCRVQSLFCRDSE